MAGYIEFNVEADVQTMIDAALTRLAAKFPGIVFNEAHLEVAVIEEMARMAHETAVVAANVPRAIFRRFGEELVGLEVIDGAPARGAVTVVAIDNLGYTLPAGYTVGYRHTGDELWLFTLDIDAVIAPGSLQVAGVPITAVDIGISRNGIAAMSDMERVESVAWVSEIHIDPNTTTAGGVDAETDDEYLDRLADELTLLTPRPILPGDFEVLARRTEGVFRALAIDGYNPADQTFNNERFVTVAAVAEDGTTVTAGELAALLADLDTRREVNFEVRTIDPVYNDVTVTFTIVVVAGADEAAVLEAAESAVTDYLDPALWAGGSNDPPTWEGETQVRYNELITVLENTVGVERVTALAINNGDVGVNFALTGVAPLPRAIGQVIEDQFLRADDPDTIGNATSGHVWVQQTGVWGIAGNAGFESADTANASVAIAGVRPDGVLTCAIDLDAVADCGVIFRGIDADNYLFFSLASCSLNKRDVGVNTQLADSADVALDVVHTVEVRLSGDSIVVLVDDVAKIDYALAGGDSVKFKSPANARVGLRANADMGARFDNFEFREATGVKGAVA
jgi:hypothetical protein